MQVVFRSTFYEPTGFGNSARHIAYKMEEAGIDVKIEPLGQTHQFLDESEMQRLRTMEHKPLQEEQILLTLDIERRPEDQGRFRKAISCTMWETSKAPAEHITKLNSFDALILPNEFNRQSFLNGGAKLPIYVAPYSVDSELFQPGGEKNRLGEPEELFIFYSVFGWSERKAPHLLLRAYMQEFGAEEQVLLLLKTFGNDIEHLPQSWYDEAMSRYADTSAKPRVRVVSKLMNPQEMAELYRGIDCFVLPTRGEGVGLPILESMASAKPVIATGWSSHTDFLNPTNGYLIPYRLVPARPLHYTNSYKPDQLWAEADIGALQLLMRRVYSCREEARVKALFARETAKKWNWQRTADAFIHALEATAGCKLTKEEVST